MSSSAVQGDVGCCLPVAVPWGAPAWGAFPGAMPGCTGTLAADTRGPQPRLSAAAEQHVLFYVGLNPNLTAGGISLTVKISNVLLEEKELFFPFFFFLQNYSHTVSLPRHRF